jgi:colanic acid/amylovoran biosynthesis glycosyltransferase
MMLGRMVEKKGYDVGIEAVTSAAAMDRNHRYILDIIGEGPLKAALEVLAKRQRRKNLTVNFLTIKENALVRKAYREHHLFLVPSKTAANGDQEGLPRTVTEALAIGTPVVAARHSGIPEAIVDRQTGLLFNEGDSRDAAQKIVWAVKNRAEMVKYSRNGRSRFETLFGAKRRPVIARRYAEPLKSFFTLLER